VSNIALDALGGDSKSSEHEKQWDNMKVVTILGIGRVKDKFEDRPIYKYDKRLEHLYILKKQRYTNMLALLVDNFDPQDIIPIFTMDAKTSQAAVLKNEFQDEHIEIFNDKNFISNDKDFYKILRIINDTISDEDEYIIDLTHGFRHIPIALIFLVLVFCYIFSG